MTTALTARIIRQARIIGRPTWTPATLRAIARLYWLARRVAERETAQG